MLRYRPAVLPLFRRAGILFALSAYVLLTCVFATAQTGVQVWGNNQYGQLGIGTNISTNVPLTVNDLTGVGALAAGGFHTLTLKSDGTICAWGRNDYGQLGDGTSVLSSNLPVSVSGLTNAVAVACGLNHSLALLSDGTVWAWGNNTHGELGNGTTINSNVPVQVVGLADITAIGGGASHSLALKSDGTVWAWGSNIYGQLGDGSNNGSSLPVQVMDLTDITAIASSSLHSLARKSDGTVWAWGYNASGQLGDGTQTGSNVPVQVTDLADITAIAGGSAHSLALKSDGTVWAWGDSFYGELGNGTIGFGSLSLVPVAVLGLTDVVTLASGGYHSLALKSDGTVWSWGRNDYGQLGDGRFDIVSPYGEASPVQVVGLTSVVAVAGGGIHSLAITASAATVSGTVTLQGCTASGQPITFEFRPTDGSAPFVLVTTLDASGAFRLPDIPRKNYTVWIKGAKWLAQVVPVDASAGNVSGVTATLLAGDVNNDNAVTTADYLLLIAAFGSQSGDPNWNDAADLNCDGVISTEDYLLLKANFGQVGDP